MEPVSCKRSLIELQIAQLAIMLCTESYEMQKGQFYIQDDNGKQE